jgi:hypothetical protein
MEAEATYKKEGGLTLPKSGKSVTILEGKGRHARLATRMCDGDMSMYMNALMSMLVEIDGKKLSMEEFDDLDIKDYNFLMTEIGSSFT